MAGWGQTDGWRGLFSLCSSVCVTLWFLLLCNRNCSLLTDSHSDGVWWRLLAVSVWRLSAAHSDWGTQLFMQYHVFYSHREPFWSSLTPETGLPIYLWVPILTGTFFLVPPWLWLKWSRTVRKGDGVVWGYWRWMGGWEGVPLQLLYTRVQFICIYFHYYANDIHIKNNSNANKMT